MHKPRHKRHLLVSFAFSCATLATVEQKFGKITLYICYAHHCEHKPGSSDLSRVRPESGRHGQSMHAGTANSGGQSSRWKWTESGIETKQKNSPEKAKPSLH